MKIGYPCINLSVECSGSKTFRLRSYSPQLLKDVVENNLTCLEKMLAFNVEHNILFFRISSDIVPFASHPVCKFNWQSEFRKRFASIGEFIRSRRMRISMHPDQFILINALDPQIVKRSIAELKYHAQVLDLLGLDTKAKMQIHVGGVYGQKVKSIKRFVKNYLKLPEIIKRRLIVENDERSYTIKDCLFIYKETGVPVLFDIFHHRLNGDSSTPRQVLRLVGKTWKKKDGLPMVDYSSQQQFARAGSHAYTIDSNDFACFLAETAPVDFDIMLEIKDKEKSAQLAIAVAEKDKRFVGTC